MQDQIIREAFLTKSTEKDTYSFLASSEKVDSYGDIVVQDGIDLSRYKKNPIILYQHNSSEPIGTSKVRMSDKGIVADITLAEPGISEKIDTIRGLIEAKILRAVSIGFSAIEWEPIRDDENNFTGYKFLKSLLHEISVVSIPANDEALAIARSFNLPRKELQAMFMNPEQVEKQAHNRNRLRLLQIGSL